MDSFVNNKFSQQEVPMRNAMNEITRAAYVEGLQCRHKKMEPFN